MQIGTRFSVAIHILLIIEVFRKERRVTSEFIAGSVNTNPVVIRRLMGRLRDAGLIDVATGTGGLRLARDPREISLLDILRAVEAMKDGALFKIHEDTAPGCPVGGNIAELLEGRFLDAQKAMEKQLGKATLRDLLQEVEHHTARVS